MLRRTALLLILAGILADVLPGAAQAARKTVVLRSAPVAMAGFNVEFPKLWVPAPKLDGSVVGMDARLVDTHGKAVTIRDVMLHHVVFYKRTRPASPSVCAGNSQEAFYGTGEELQQLRLPAGYGYPVAKGERWKMNAMLMSHSLRSLKVRVEYTVTIETGNRLEPVIPLWVRANGCGDAVSYPVWGGGGPGGVDTRTYDWRVPFDARIVAVGGHLHGGAKDMYLTQPQCGGRRLLDTTPRYGMPDDLYYTARPILHEPGPVDTRYFLSATGIQVRRGEILRLTGTYDSSRPHTRVMSIMHIYLAKHAAPATQDCAALPADAQELVKDRPVRLDPPDVPVPLNVLGDDGHTHEITTLPWTPRPLGDPASVALKDNAFDPPYVQLKSGSKLTWRFHDRVAHNVTFANGPMLQGSPTLAGGKTFTTQFTRAGRYELFCYLHPLQMHQVIDVVG
jgi:hypothetical protein